MVSSRSMQAVRRAMSELREEVRSHLLADAFGIVMSIHRGSHLNDLWLQVALWRAANL